MPASEQLVEGAVVQLHRVDRVRVIELVLRRRVVLHVEEIPQRIKEVRVVIHARIFAVRPIVA